MVQGLGVKGFRFQGSLNSGVEGVSSLKTKWLIRGS